MTADVLTDMGTPIPPDLMEKWCQTWADGDRRLRVQEISLKVLGRHLPPTPGQLWERVREAASVSANIPQAYTSAD
jgi:hypothetical protein